MEKGYRYILYSSLYKDLPEVLMGIEDRGFASMDPALQREIASKGGKTAHERGAARKWTSETAKKAVMKRVDKVLQEKCGMTKSELTQAADGVI